MSFADAAEEVAYPQISNQGTLGKNISQDTRCWYYRSGSEHIINNDIALIVS